MGSLGEASTLFEASSIFLMSQTAWRQLVWTLMVSRAQLTLAPSPLGDAREKITSYKSLISNSSQKKYCNKLSAARTIFQLIQNHACLRSICDPKIAFRSQKCRLLSFSRIRVNDRLKFHGRKLQKRLFVAKVSWNNEKRKFPFEVKAGRRKV